MRLIVKYHPEINIKSRSVRRRFSKLLESNTRSIIKRIFESAHVISRWSDLLIETTELPRDTELEIIDALLRIPGVDQFNEVIEYPFVDFDTAFKDVARHWQDELEGKSFCVRVKRSGKHDFTSSELERYIGGGLNQAVESAKVSLRNPDITVKAELRGDRFQVVKKHYRGLGGMPIPSQEDVLSLISGGFDSGVATYHLMRRGARTHFCFFNLGGKEHEIGVKQVSYEIWKRYSSTQN